MYFDDEASRAIFSVFEFRYKCSSDAAVGGYCSYKAMIEPLAFTLRHPVALCYDAFPDKTKLLENRQDSLMDQSYLFYATKQLVEFGPAQHTHVDLGALVRGYVRAFSLCSCAQIDFLPLFNVRKLSFGSYT